jgi:hypothetical protein
MPNEGPSKANMARLYNAAVKKVQSRIAANNKKLSGKPDRLMQGFSRSGNASEIAKTFKQDVKSAYGKSLDSTGSAKSYLDKVNKRTGSAKAAMKSGKLK